MQIAQAAGNKVFVDGNGNITINGVMFATAGPVTSPFTTSTAGQMAQSTADGLILATPFVLGANVGTGVTAYQAATANYSLAAGAATGATVSSVLYTGQTIGTSYLSSNRTWEGFTSQFSQNFSGSTLGITAAYGAMNGVYATQMFGWAAIPNSFTNWLTVPGAVIRVNGTAAAAGATAATVGWNQGGGQ